MKAIFDSQTAYDLLLGGKTDRSKDIKILYEIPLSGQMERSHHQTSVAYSM